MQRIAMLGLCFVVANLSYAEDVVLDKDISFCKVDGIELKLDLYRPKSHVENDSSKQPCVVAIFGGGFHVGSKEMMRMFCEQFARAGYVVIAPNYRLVPQAHFPAPIEDCKCAVRWIRAHADEYRVQADKIGAMGISAGGYLSMMLGYTDPSDGFEGNGGNEEHSSKVQAAVNYAGAFDLTLRDWEPKHEPKIVNFVGCSIDEDLDRYRKASPRTYVHANDAPTLSLHGTRDMVVPYGQAVLVDATLKSIGVASDLKLVPGASHGWLGKELQETQRLVIQFLDHHLRGHASDAAQAQ
ncbi:MAG: alpha/beta hydrolase [Planctomycetota bacterium]